MAIVKWFSKLSLRWKIYFSLAGILFPVFVLTLLIQTKVTRPFLENEVRQVALSICRSLASDIIAFHWLNQPEQLEARLVEISWMQPNITRMDVLIRDQESWKSVASNVTLDTELDFSELQFKEHPIANLLDEEDRRYWKVVYPIKNKAHRKIIGYIHAEVSLQLVNHVVGSFSKIALLGALLAMGLLIGLLSYYLRKMIENERKLKLAESENLELTQRLHATQKQLFLNEKLAVMGQLTASFAHEIGTPLNSLSCHLQLLKEETSNSAARNRIEIIDSQVSRIEGIVKDFLASTHAPPQQRQLVDVRSLIERITNLVTPQLQTLKVDLSIQVDPHLDPLRVVPSDLEQILLNLTNNALDALESCAEGPRKLFFHAYCIRQDKGKLLSLRVQDTGGGMEPSVLKQVVKPFFTTKAPGQGTGLGLTISQRLIKKYGGYLNLDSTLGKGTTVTVSLPYDIA